MAPRDVLLQSTDSPRHTTTKQRIPGDTVNRLRSAPQADQPPAAAQGTLAALAIAAVLLFGVALVVFLADHTLQADPSEWMATARQLYLTGDTGLQHRNILFAYILALPMLLGTDPVWFGVAVSGTSFILTALLLYRINIRHVSHLLAAYTSLLFIVSYAFLRYGTQVFSDAPTIFCLAAMIFFQFRFLESRKPADLLLSYCAAGAAVSFRYASAFFFVPFLYYVWATRRAYKWHLLGILVALIPYVPPQLWFNVTYLHNPLAVSYAAKHPILAWRFFRQEMGNGIQWQLAHYIRYFLFDFRGLFVVLTPVCALGVVRSSRRIARPMSLYLVLFVLSFLAFLAFYAFFSNRYILPALLPCFIWLPIGIERLGRLLPQGSRTWRTVYLAGLAVIAYGMFEVSFQLVQSSRAMHEGRVTLMRDLAEIVHDGDVVITLPSMRESVVRLVPKDIEAVGLATLTPENLAQFAGRESYVVWTPKQWTSEGSESSLAVDAVRDRLTPVHTLKSPGVVELILYRLLRQIGFAGLIPAEEWVVFRVALPP
jgi:hypothetical protein